MAQLTNRLVALAYFAVFAMIEYASWFLYRLVVTPERAGLVAAMLAIVSVGYNGLLGQLFGGLYFWASPEDRLKLGTHGTFSVWRADIAKFVGFVMMIVAATVILPATAYVFYAGVRYETAQKLVRLLMFMPSISCLLLAIARRVQVLRRSDSSS